MIGREAVGGINGMGNAVIGVLVHNFVIFCEPLCMEMDFVRSFVLGFSFFTLKYDL